MLHTSAKVFLFPQDRALFNALRNWAALLEILASQTFLYMSDLFKTLDRKWLPAPRVLFLSTRCIQNLLLSSNNLLFFNKTFSKGIGSDDSLLLHLPHPLLITINITKYHNSLLLIYCCRKKSYSPEKKRQAIYMKRPRLYPNHLPGHDVELCNSSICCFAEGW